MLQLSKFFTLNSLQELLVLQLLHLSFLLLTLSFLFNGLIEQLLSVQFLALILLFVLTVKNLNSMMRGKLKKVQLQLVLKYFFPYHRTCHYPFARLLI